MVLVVPEQSQRPYRFGMTLLCVGALFNWLGLADTYSDPVPAIRYIGVGLIAAGASLICMAMCFWMRNIRDPSISSDYDISSDPVHVISVNPSLEKPPDYSTVVDVPPCYEDAIKLTPTGLTSLHTIKNVPSVNVHTVNRTTAINESSNKNCNIDANIEGNNSLSFDQSTDNVDFSITTEKSDEIVSSISAINSSQNENSLAKVLRKSIREIRKLRNGTEDCNNLNENYSIFESDFPTDKSLHVESTSKSDR